ncbi:MAG TPA: 6-bladed beta-propeller [Ramlibacter sp.]|uniref:6-bladed beta-propeller n=1 Tax=Ramlibacter sp. TaxID=1917967 RepID=UPI002D80263D|nr:6-bladed beta-propeller [Ramlibacter sp.]HET8745412.1 6-bladed beta-propeller [Ramlibacter sp.]
MTRLPAACLALLLAACASEPMVMRLEPPTGAASRLFPPPETQEVPRYRFVGELRGETNFSPRDGSRSVGRSLFALIAGLDATPQQPLMLVRPQSGVVDRQGRVLVTDVGRAAIMVFDEANGKLQVWEKANRSTHFASPIAIALGREGELLVTDSDLARVFRLAPDGAPRGEFGAGLLQRPTGIARDAARGRIYVADSHGHDIKVFDDAGRHLATWGTRGDAPGELNYPTHLALSDGVLLVADSMNARIQGFDAEGKLVLRFGQRGLYVGNLVRPKGVAADDEGNLYVVESMHDTLLVYDRGGRLLMPLGGTDSSGGSRFHLPAGVWVDARNRVYVADMFNARVAVFQFLGGN